LLWRAHASPEDLLEAAAAAHIRQEFEEFPQGFETMVGERGVTLSGGQKQRAAIARALLRRPAILILDDALSSVDTYTEERILNGLRGYTEGATTILISHRVSTVRNADQIAVLDRGRIVELGRHDELLSLDGYYAGLYRKQQLEEELTVAAEPRPDLLQLLNVSDNLYWRPAQAFHLEPAEASSPKSALSKPSCLRRDNMAETWAGAGLTSGSLATWRQASRTFLTHSMACSNFCREADCEACSICAKIDA